MQIKKNLTFLFFFLTFCTKAFSLNDDFFFAVEPNASFTFGELGDYLFSNSNKDFIISHLEWEEKPLIKTGINICSGWKNIHAKIGTDITIPLTCGQMLDSDYDPKYKHKTMLGVFDNIAQLNYTLFAELFYDFPINSIFSFSPTLKVKYSYNSFTTKNGHGWYGNKDIAYDDEKATYHPRLSHIDYMRKSLLFYIGLKLNYSTQKFNFSIGTFFSPYTYFYTKNYHSDETNSDQDFYCISIQDDYIKGINQIFITEFLIDESKILSFKCEITHTPIFRGITATNRFRGTSYGSSINDVEWSKMSQDTGSDILEINISTGFKIIF